MILRRAIEALGADYDQWRVLSRVMLRNDLRSVSSLQLDTGEKKGGSSRVWLTFLLYGAFGLWVAMMASAVPGLFLGGTIALSAAGVMIAMAILVDFQNVVVSPDDYHILAPQPVSSATYFVVKVTNVLVYTGIMGILLGGPTTLSLGLRHGALAALGWLPALAGMVVWTTLAMILLYTTLLQFVHPRRLRLALSYLQIILMMAVMGAPLFMTELTDYLGQADFEPTAALLLVPSAWFAGVLPLATGDWSLGGGIGALAGAGSLGVFVLYCRHGLSMSYSERLGTMMAASEARRPRDWPRRLGWPGIPPELRVVSTLVRGQFRHDMNFRLSVLSIIPVTLFYLLFATRDGPLPDPFVQLGFSAGSLWMIHFAALAMPVAVMDSLFRSESYPAAWVFFAAPVDRAKLVVNAGICVAVFFVAPYAVLLAGIFLWSFGNAVHALVHAVVLGVFAHLALQLRLLASPLLPFSEPPRKGSAMGNLMGMILISMMIAVFLPLIFRVGYANEALTAVLMGTLVLLAVLLPRAVERSIRPRVQRLEFAG